jgi:Leucine-rich repeat (LRR) protein
MRPPHFGQDITNTQNNNNNSSGGDEDGSNDRTRQEYIISRLTQNGATPVAHIAGKGIIRVVSRCEDAKENSNLDLSECSLIQVPDAVYHLMRHTELKSCDLSGNVITKISPKFAVKFNLITELNLSHNQMAKLPDELCDLNFLETLDISNNTFLTLPPVVFKLKKLKKLIANNNKIFEIDFDLLDVNNTCLEYVDLKNNPLTGICIDILKEAKVNFKIEFSERQKEEWEDLEI